MQHNLIRRWQSNAFARFFDIFGGVSPAVVAVVMAIKSDGSNACLGF